MALLTLLLACDATVRTTVVGGDTGPVDTPCQQLWFDDADGDGFGAGTGQAACEAPEGWVENGADCDDADREVNPAAEEVCEDGLDNNCDGTARGCTPLGIRKLDEGDVSILGEAEEDDLGEVLAMAGDLNGDGHDDLAIGAPYARGATGYASVFLGPLETSATLSEADRLWSGPNSGDYLGVSVTGAGDLNGDGFDDLAIGALGDDQIASGAGAVYLIHGPSLALDLEAATGVLLGRDAGEETGARVHSAGDLDGDGLADLLIGAPGHHDGGRVYIVHGPVTATYNLAIADTVFTGQSTSDGAGETVAVGDLNGDGHADYAIGAPSADGLASDGGMVYVVPGPVGAEVSLDQVAGRVWGGSWDRLATSLAIPGDLDLDGVDELVAGSPYVDIDDSDQGRAYLFLEPVEGSVDADSAPVHFSGEIGHDHFAATVSGAGDVNGDGWADLLIGAPYNDFGGGDAGATYLFYGPLTASRSGTTADAKFTGPVSSELLGTGLAGQGDLDADGLDDLAMGALGVRWDGQTTGGVYVVRAGDRL